MPMYDYKCAHCFHRREVLLKLSDLGADVICAHCGSLMNRQLSAPWVQGDFKPYESPVVPGRIIHGRREHEEHLRETGCRLLEPGETDNYRRSFKQADALLEKKLEETADQFIAGLPTDKRDRLAAEMEGGLDAKVERSTPKMT